jgi:phytoene dehydrogenase-like protein
MLNSSSVTIYPWSGEVGIMGAVIDRLGEVGLPAPMSELRARRWDVVVIGGGHNGLTAAAYLARAGRTVLVLERAARLGGACTLERPFPDQRFVVSPCAYVVGLLDQMVIDELDLARRGLEVFVADPNLWAPFEDGRSFAQWSDDAATQASLESLGLSHHDIDGYWAYEHVFDEMRRMLRTGARDTWIGESPTRDELEAMLGHDRWLIDILFEASIADVLDHYIDDACLKDALYGQGVIGAYAGPRDAGTASIKLMHYQGDLQGQGPVWGYVRGGMGMVSFTIAEAAQEAGAVLACGVEVAEVRPGEGVVLVGGDVISAEVVICNADPKRARSMLAAGDALPPDYGARLDAWKVRSPVVKFNAALHRLPTFTAADGATWPYRSMISVTPGMDAAQDAFAACDAGAPSVGFGEVYFQTGFDPSPAPEGHHLMSVFGQYAPYTLADGSWDDARESVGQQFVDLIARFAPDVGDCIEHAEVLGGPDIEERIGLTGGHIFQGETMPDQMWEHRLSARTPVEGFYLCGAATHPAGSVIALNGRNAAFAVLADHPSDD